MKRRFSILVACVGLAALAGCNDRPAEPGTATGAATGTSADTMEKLETNANRAGQAVDDAVLTTKVKTALLAEEGLDAGAISVSSEKGVVTLRGNIPANQITRADAVARKVEGVQEVINALAAPPSS
ncbi:BON domain-containing protein [Aromatoleum bremense]|uniref:BON domain-containing protein n=1 Tax=Aromatoleum bremense TaxID=76115 RepID=A0ABX1NYI5_9RHOO|nr:BON domain-containing protein [Aromatoleum bremense]NMG17098.1 BON domain-containing protein [Aromatoleum bremense]QTQ33426.1 BON domain-containing protein [Aromatoleum bremense]